MVKWLKKSVLSEQDLFQYPKNVIVHGKCTWKLKQKFQERGP